MRGTLRARAALVRMVILATVVATIPSSLYAQAPAANNSKVPVRATGVLRAASLTPGIDLDVREDRRSIARVRNSQARPRRSAVGWGILGGVVAGLAVSGAAANRRGENEGGEFCTRCFVTWSAVTLPVGAGLGALAGYLVDVARR